MATLQPNLKRAMLECARQEESVESGAQRGFRHFQGLSRANNRDDERADFDERTRQKAPFA